jgi:AraC-like DNA-binding protein
MGTRVADTIRASFLTGYVELARAVGLDPLRMLDAVGIPRAALAEPDMKLSTVAGRDLLEASARAAEDFGLRLSELRSPSIMGPAALVLREQPTVRAVIHAMIRYGSLHTDSNKLYLEEADDLAILRLTLRYPSPGPCRQGTELSMGQILKVLRIYLGADWRPMSVSLVHAAPRSLDTHRRVFRSRVLFDQDCNSFVFSRAELDSPNPAADPAMAREIERYVEGLAASKQASLPDRVRELAHGLLPMGHCTIHFVARQIGVDPRTLQRQLADHGTSFLDIVQSTRMGLIPQYLEQSDRPLAEVADLLGFSALSAFSRWHRAHYRQSASAHRDAARAANSIPA